MYLSRVNLTGQYTRNPYEYHKGLWQLFLDSPDRKRDFLYRVEQEQLGCVSILVQSLRPSRSVTDECVAILASKQWQPKFYSGQMLRFFLHANPTKTIKDEQQRKNKKGEVKSCRVPLADFIEQRRWLERHFSNAAQIHELDINPLAPIYFRKRQTNAGKIQPVRYQGVLSVTEPEQLKEMLRSGIGPAKAFGCGMLSLAPA